MRERREDIPDLVRHFLVEAVRDGLPAKAFDKDAIERLKDHDWHGNVRELENLVRRVVALHSEYLLGVSAVTAALEVGSGATPQREESLSAAVERHLSKYFAAHGERLPPSGLYTRILREVERPMIEMSLAATRGNQLQAARLLGRKKIRELEITTGQRRSERTTQ